MPAVIRNPHPGNDPWAQSGNPNDPRREEWKTRRDAYENERAEHVEVAGRDPVRVNPGNYKVYDENDAIDLRRREADARTRQGVQIDQRLANEQLANAYAARGRQQEAAMLHGAAAMGIGPSAAQEQMRMALDAQAQGGARAATMGGGARAIAGSNAAYGTALGQTAMGRQTETQNAYRGAGQSLVGMRGQDIVTMRGSQDAAYQQAQLEAQQRARNDALARAYLGEGNSLLLEQLGADQAYEAQINANKLGVSGDMERKRQRDAQQQATEVGAYTALAGGLLTGVAKR